MNFECRKSKPSYMKYPKISVYISILYEKFQFLSMWVNYMILNNFSTLSIDVWNEYCSTVMRTNFTAFIMNIYLIFKNLDLIVDVVREMALLGPTS